MLFFWLFCRLFEVVAMGLLDYYISHFLTNQIYRSSFEFLQNYRLTTHWIYPNFCSFSVLLANFRSSILKSLINLAEHF